MAYFKHLNCCFIHIPKTGGESVYSLLAGTRPRSFFHHFSANPITSFKQWNLNRRGKHATAGQIADYLGEGLYQASYKFTVVRNPFDLMVSFYEHLRKPLYKPEYKGKTMYPSQASKLAMKLSFGEWLEIVLSPENIEDEQQRKHFPVKHFSPQSDYFDEIHKIEDLNRVVRFESLSQDIKEVTAELGLNGLQMPHLNASSRKPAKTYYETYSKSLLESFYKEDLNRFSYIL